MKAYLLAAAVVATLSGPALADKFSGPFGRAHLPACWHEVTNYNSGPEPMSCPPLGSGADPIVRAGPASAPTPDPDPKPCEPKYPRDTQSKPDQDNA